MPIGRWKRRLASIQMERLTDINFHTICLRFGTMANAHLD